MVVVTGGYGVDSLGFLSRGEVTDFSPFRCSLFDTFRRVDASLRLPTCEVVAFCEDVCAYVRSLYLVRTIPSEDVRRHRFD